MKIKLNSALIATCFAVITLISCESHEQKADDAFENVKEEKLKSKNSTPQEVKVLKDSSKTELLKKKEKTDEWTQFKLETEKKIQANEIKIKEIKGIPNADTKLLKQVTNLEKENNDLRKQMDVYKEEVKVMWESFKTKINHDVTEINIELKDLKLNNK